VSELSGVSELRVGLPAGGPRPSLVDGVYENLATKVWARVEGDELVCPLPRARFAAVELAEVFGLPQSFVAAHAEASRALGGPYRLDAERGVAWSRYVRSRGHMRTTWPSADVVVPELMLFARKATGEVSRALIWPEETSAIVVPEAADLVALKPSAILMLAAVARPVRLLRRQDVLEALADRAERGGQEPVPHRLYRGGEGTHVVIVARLRQLEGFPAADFKAVGAADVVDL
jgi:hypothetical protein